MEVTVEVPVVNDKKGRAIKLTLETDTGQVKIRLPATFKTDVVDLTTLHARVSELQAMVQGRAYIEASE